MQQRKKRKHRISGWDEWWDFHFQELQAFVAEKGHSRVPARWKLNPSLGRWVAHQRELARQGLIEPDRAQRLQKLGLEWTIDEVYNEETDRCLKRMLARLEAFRKEHGHSAVPPSHDRTCGDGSRRSAASLPSPSWVPVAVAPLTWPAFLGSVETLGGKRASFAFANFTADTGTPMFLTVPQTILAWGLGSTCNVKPSERDAYRRTAAVGSMKSGRDGQERIVGQGRARIPDRKRTRKYRLPRESRPFA